MEAVCGRGDGMCQAYALSAALHSLNLYCSAISAALVCCCVNRRPHCVRKRWRLQNTRGITSLVLAVVWCCSAASASLRPAATVHLVASLMAPLSWLAAAALHVSLWKRRSAAPILYLGIYWFLASICSAAVLFENMKKENFVTHIEVYLQALCLFLTTIMTCVDCLCFYDEVVKRNYSIQKSTDPYKIVYKHNETHFYGKITFFWLNSILYKGCEEPLEGDDLGFLPEREKSKTCFQKFKDTYYGQKASKDKQDRPSLWKCHAASVWPNFYIAGVLKMFGDIVGVIPPLGLGVIIQFIEKPLMTSYESTDVTVDEFLNNGYAMLMIVTLALVVQALLSQNSTHLVTVEGSRLKTSLQNMVFDKCTRLASWSTHEGKEDEQSPLLHMPKEEASQTGMLMNLVSQDTYNIMSCVWICHYSWAIPLKVTVILYLLYMKLGISAIIGAATSVLLITPLQFYIGKRISDNSRIISKCTDHRVSKMAEILNGINVIKLFVWEDLFNEKILQLREVELKHLNKDSIYWGFLTFTTQFSSVLITVITFVAQYWLNKSSALTTVNVFAGLVLFNQLTIPLLILPVTVLMIIQAMVSTQRIQDFLDLPESKNYNEDISKNYEFNDEQFAQNNPISQINESKYESMVNNADCNHSDYLMRFRSAAFSWGTKENTCLEIENLDLPSGKLIMVIGSSNSGKSSLLSAVLGEMQLEHGHVDTNGHFSKWYSGQPPWLLDWSIRDNILMGSTWCATRYLRVVRAVGLRPDLQLLPDGDKTILGSYGTPLSGGQRVRVCIARALYSRARLLAFDEPLSALDVPLARQVVARALLPAARSGRTILLATSRLELLHYADLVIVMDGGRVGGVGRPGLCEGTLGEWWSLAGEARASAARCGAGPPGGTAQERSHLLHALSKIKNQRSVSEDNIIGVSEATGAHLLAEVWTCGAGTWRKTSKRTRSALSRQFSSPPATVQDHKLRREVRRTVSADASSDTLQRDASLLRRLLRPRATNTLTRWTPKTLRRFISSDSDDNVEIGSKDPVDVTLESTFTSLTSNGAENVGTCDAPIAREESDPLRNEWSVWKEYIKSCGWWGVMFCITAATAQGLVVAADCWLSHLADQNTRQNLTRQQMWEMVRTYAGWCACGATAGGLAQAACACAGAAARRLVHEKLLATTLHTPLYHHHATPQGAYVHRFSADITIIDKKLPTAISRWVQLTLLCGAAFLVNIILSPFTLLVLLPAAFFYFALQSVYLKNASELQRIEASSAASVVSLTAQTSAGAVTVRAGQLQARLRDVFQKRVDDNHNALLLLNASNRWLGLGLDLVGVCTVFTALSVALYSESSGSVAGLAGTYALLLPVYLAHLAKCRADLHLQLASLERILSDTIVPQEDYRDDYPIPAGWQRSGRIEFQGVNVQHQPGAPIILNDVNFVVEPGQKVAVCGRSGSGKSTLLLTCAGATEIHSGRVLIDGQDITRVPLKPLRHRIVVLPQENIMFSGTLRENLDPLAVHTDEEIWQCLKAVGLYDFVTAQSAGLECIVSNRNNGWSGGGRVGRVCAARAVLHARPAAALLLDEPAAALDASAQRALLRALATLAPNTTIITVAHRLSSVRDYDNCVILEKGRLVEQGNINSLLSDPSSRLSCMLTTPAHLI
ncbi:ATP-binding cassette sub-family C member Sur [Pieris rapae]|uniref:ATP-binding cassette sub-family C member Sur n=1 Tax=Pieris rapae TaxID=64459 RepID=UPI001E27CDD6|nr:ATP-binding cassette sub-family C member Sur [Pieris rapae]